MNNYSVFSPFFSSGEAPNLWIGLKAALSGFCSAAAAPERMKMLVVSPPFWQDERQIAKAADNRTADKAAESLLIIFRS